MTRIDPKSYKQDVPEFGHKMLKYYALDPEYINPNNGSYGRTPKPIQLAIDEITAKSRSCPDLFHKISYLPMLIDTREKLAFLVGAKKDEVVLVENASVALNFDLQNFEWEEVDIVISFSSTYNAISRTVEHISDPSDIMHHESRVPSDPQRYHLSVQSTLAKEPCKTQ
ncbi:hypothetical protein CVT25_008546 [Psilocybe cyanescens]|uniref:Aminotransferase class V domain-containing protein n=1 Tax=Psilocybe cyanescens TaxID=93625 RepID=A0A409XD57_PSICY|nr:hypothetical protein CVT25_008546 [Psilocybe cyanescens]